jgi:hypothetical protein
MSKSVLRVRRARVEITSFLEEEMRKLIARTALAMIAATLVIPDASAQAAAVNFQFRQDGAGLSVPYTEIGAAPDAGTFWNQVNFTGVSNSSINYALPATIFASDGTTSSSSTISSFTPSGTGVVSIFADSGNAATTIDLVRTWLLTLGDGQIAMTIGGLTSGEAYDLYLYGQNAQFYGDVTRFTVVGAGNSIVDNRPPTTQSPFSFQLGGNYALFSSVLADGAGQITVTVAQADFESAFNGFQIVTVPEPTTVIVAAIGAMCALLPRRGLGKRNA